MLKTRPLSAPLVISFRSCCGRRFVVQRRARLLQRDLGAALPGDADGQPAVGALLDVVALLEPQLADLELQRLVLVEDEDGGDVQLRDHRCAPARVPGWGLSSMLGTRSATTASPSLLDPTPAAARGERHASNPGQPSSTGMLLRAPPLHKVGKIPLGGLRKRLEFRYGDVQSEPSPLPASRLHVGDAPEHAGGLQAPQLEPERVNLGGRLSQPVLGCPVALQPRLLMLIDSLITSANVDASEVCCTRPLKQAHLWSASVAPSTHHVDERRAGPSRSTVLSSHPCSDADGCPSWAAMPPGLLG